MDSVLPVILLAWLMFLTERNLYQEELRRQTKYFNAVLSLPTFNLCLFTVQYMQYTLHRVCVQSNNNNDVCTIFQTVNVNCANIVGDSRNKTFKVTLAASLKARPTAEYYVLVEG